MIIRVTRVILRVLRASIILDVIWFGKTIAVIRVLGGCMPQH